MYWVKTAPATEPVSIEEAKTHLRVDTSGDDTYITSLITVARQWVEQFLGRALIAQTWVYARNGWPGGDEMRLPGGKLLSLVGVTYQDSTGASHTFTDVLPDLNAQSRLVLAYGKSWPSSDLYPLNPIQVEYTCGYGDATQVPQTVKQAMLLLIGHWYESREAVVQSMVIPRQQEFAVNALLQNERVYFDESR